MLKKASMGIGTLIIFISAILASAIGASVIIYTQNRLQNEALSTGAQARESVVSSIIIESVRAENIVNSKTDQFNLRVRLGSGSNPIRLDQTMLSIITKDSTTSLSFGGVGKELYFTNKEQRVINEVISNSFVRLRSDLDNDLIEDYIKVLDSTTLLFNLSSEGLVELDIPDISLVGTEINFISEIRNTNSYIQLLGTIETENVLCDNIEVIIVPNQIEEGIFSVEDPQRKYEEFYAIHQGDFIRVYFETSKKISEGEEIEFTFYTPHATPSRRSVATPSTMTGSSANIFP